MLFCWTFYSSNNPEKNGMYSIMVLTKILNSTTVFNINNNNNKKVFLEHQISILKLFLKDHLTLKTGVMTDENSVCHQKNKLIFLNSL